MVKRAHAAFDADGRCWPQPLIMPQNRVRELESTIAKLSTELNLRRTQVADFYNTRHQEAGDLLRACDEIDRLSKSVEALQDTVTQHENNAAASNQNLQLLNKENLTLRLELEKARKESAQLLQRSLSVATVLNDRNVAIASAQERHAEMTMELTAARAETIRLATAIEEASKRHRDELNQLSAQFKDQIRKIEGVAAQRGVQVKELEEVRAAIASRCDALISTVATFETAQKNPQEKVTSQSVEFLQTILRVERESAETKIAELTAALEDERTKHSAAERAAAGMRENIVLLLPKLAALRNRPSAPGLDTSMSRNHVA